MSFGAWVFAASDGANGVGGEEASYCTGREGAEVVVELVAGRCQVGCLQVGARGRDQRSRRSRVVMWASRRPERRVAFRRMS